FRYLHGFGCEKSADVMLAHGINHAAETILLEEDDPAEIMTECVTETSHVWTTPDVLLFRWLGAGNMTADGLSTWKDMAAFKALLNMKPRLPKNASEGALIHKAQQRAK